MRGVCDMLRSQEETTTSHSEEISPLRKVRLLLQQCHFFQDTKAPALFRDLLSLSFPPRVSLFGKRKGIDFRSPRGNLHRSVMTGEYSVHQKDEIGALGKQMRRIVLFLALVL